MATELLIRAMPMVEVGGSTNIPTTLCYTKDRAAFGQDAVALSKEQQIILNEDFKIDLGNYDPSRVNRKRFATGYGPDISAAELTNEFLSQVVKVTREWLSLHGLDLAPSVLLAEPLNDPAKPAWVRNYRSNIERILLGKGFLKEQIDFLPEPFAVFQFYRYGFRHPSLMDKISYRALVLDFGGGTFDVCVVESKKDGDISQSGKNSRPLGATSEPIGGFEINRLIAEHLAAVIHPKDSRIRKGIEIYRKWRSGQDDLSAFAPGYEIFVRSFDRLVHDVEASKIVLSKHISDWDIDATSNLTVPVKVFGDFFVKNSAYTTVHLKIEDVKQIFNKRVWPTLRAAIQRTIASAKSEMQSGEINAVLLSGGSCSFGWVRFLLQRDFAGEISNANILTLPEYHEIVAKGLAIECARRFSVQEGDFGALTYNRLCLTLDSGDGQELPKYQPRFTSDKVAFPEGVLLPASTALSGRIDTQLRWKFRLSQPPKKRLDYFFLRSSFNPEDVTSLQNIEEKTVFTPPRAVFDSQIQVELTVKSDGTANPRFIYKTGADGNESIAVKGKPFYLDMTTVGSIKASRAYIGIDFGTSNSAVSYLSQDSMDTLKERSTDASWLSLNQLVQILPYPLARTLSRFLGSPSNVGSQEGFLRALEFMEAALTLLAYSSFLELRTTEPGKARHFKGFTQRSIGPLWGFLRETLTALGKQAVMLSPASKLITPDNMAALNVIVNWFAQKKHQKGSNSEVDLAGAINLMANICNEVFKRSVFGFFEGVHKQKFGRTHVGRFRIAHGATQPFVAWGNYEGSEAFSEMQPFLLALDKNEALCLEPLMFWDECKIHGGEEPHLFLFDRPTKDGFDFKAVGFDCFVQIESQSKYKELTEQLTAWRESDPTTYKVKIDKFEVPDQ